MVSEPSITIASSFSVQTTFSASSLETTLPKSHLPDISIKLASNNYLLWKAQVLPVLRGYGLLGYVKDEVPCPESTIIGENGELQTNPAAAVWLRTDQLILGWMNSSLSDGPLSQVINSKPMDDDEFIICILRGLGYEFDPIVAALNARDTFPSLEGIIGKLHDFEIRIQGARTTAPSMAFYTNRGRTNSKPWINTSTHGRNHHSFTTRNLPNNTPLRAKETRFPRQNGSFNGTRQKQIPYNSNCGRGNITCFRCGGPNHKADGCFASDEEANQYKAFAAIKIGETAKDSWYSDTGANQHMTSNTNEVQGIISYPGNDSIMVGNGQGLPITGTGNVTIPTTNLKLKDVLVVPEMKKKLLYVSQFTRDNNCYFLFYPWGFILKDMKTKQVILKEASASQSVASASLSSSTAATNLVPPVISLASAPTSQRQHHMITRTQTGKLKPKKFGLDGAKPHVLLGIAWVLLSCLADSLGYYPRFCGSLQNKDSEILQFEQMIKEESQKRAKLEKNLKLRGLSTKESEGSGDENDFYSVDLTPELFTSAIETAFKTIHNFSKSLINMIKAAGWDLDAATNSIESNVVYANGAHK
ncbi:hypothetical protein POTOM_046424 [Populus tomentosa]|uniref:Retrovirus-related Pol polyprotein from transposon TNT 1-94-like beta-barrel domain-containing protein n=1 Tax=Populus tomentosa TaxID=118781 RepID=A0A8X8CDY1_POPTO|nr:hypothetical protein POTOM_046424 [Populus tomentosa]